MYHDVLLTKVIIHIVLVGLLITDVLHRRRGSTGPRLDRMLGVLVLISLFAYVNFGRFHGGIVVHISEMFHYAVAGKYFPELGYDRLYGAALVADAELAEPSLTHIRYARDLQTGGLISAKDLHSDTRFRDAFTPQRWQSFKQDLSYLLPRDRAEGWTFTLGDHGYNAPPPLVVVDWTLANALGRVDRISVHLLALLDVLLLAVAALAVWRVYGFRTAAIGAILLLSDLSGFDWIGGAFLRYGWLAAVVVAMCALERNRPLTAGLLLGSAAWLRLFPALFAAGVVLLALLRVVRSRQIDPSDLRLFMGLALASVFFVGTSLLVLDGFQVWQDFQRKILLHTSGSYTNHLGLHKLFARGSLLLWLAQAGVVAAWLWCVPRVRASQAVALGGWLIFAFADLASYYYCWLILLIAWDPTASDDWRNQAHQAAVAGVQALGLAVAVLSRETIPAYEPMIYPVVSGALLLLFAAWTLRILRTPPEAQGPTPDAVT